MATRNTTISARSLAASQYRETNSFELELLSRHDVYFAENGPEIQTDIDALLSSIRERGFETPLKVRKVNERYEIIDGKARWMCAVALGVKTLPGAVFKISDEMAYWRRVAHYSEKRRLQRA